LGGETAVSDFLPALDRRAFLSGLGGAATLTFGWPLLDKAMADEVSPGQKLKPGDFTWTPDAAPTGQVAILVSIPDQLVTVYRGGSVIATSTCSTGKLGHGTPTGTFTILEKARVHHSSTYNDAPMPNMERLTWSGIALHAGNLPGYPASHGCVRLPMDFSALLFTVTHVGTTVTITDTHTPPMVVEHQGVVLAKYASPGNADVATALERATASSLRDKIVPPVPRPNPSPAAAAPAPASPAAPPAPAAASATAPAPEEEAPLVAVVISSADQRIVVFDHDDIVADGRAFIKDPGTKLGSHVFILAGSDGSGMTWHEFTYAAAAGEAISEPDAGLLRRITGDTSVIEAMKSRMHPGMVLVTTDDPISPDTFTGGGFSILTSDARPMSQR
jgi:hypothetical protein